MTSERTDGVWSRRQFVKASAAAPIAGALASPIWAFAGGSDRIKVGLIGCGGRGTGAAVQALRADPGNVLWAVGDAFADHLETGLGNIRKAMAGNDTEQINVPPDRRFVGLEAFQRVIEQTDVVILTTPPAFRPEHLAAAVGAGRHVFCEKPVAVDGPGIRSVLESVGIAAQKNLSLMSGFCWRHHDQVRSAFDQIRQGAIGSVRAVHSTYNTTGWVEPTRRAPGWSDTEWQVRDWHYFHPLSGDHIVEQAVHAIDWITWALGGATPTRCTAVGGRMTRPDTPETGNVYDNFAVTYEFEDGSRGFHMCRHWPNTPADNTGYVIGESGTLRLEPWTGRHVINGDNPWQCTLPRNDMYQREHDELFAAIRSGNRFDDGRQMAHTTLMAIMGRMAAYTGQVVTWDQALNSKENLNPDPWTWGDRPAPELAVPGRTKLI